MDVLEITILVKARSVETHLYPSTILFARLEGTNFKTWKILKNGKEIKLSHVSFATTSYSRPKFLTHLEKDIGML